MANLNRIFLMGNLTRDPELRYTPGGAAVTSFGLAINTTIGRSDGGEPKEETCFVRVVVWGKQAESCKQYLTKGRLVCVEGRLIYRSWEQDGKTRSTLEVRADRVQFLGGAPRPRGGGDEAPSGEAAAVDVAAHEPDGERAVEDDEPPF